MRLLVIATLATALMSCLPLAVTPSSTPTSSPTAATATSTVTPSPAATQGAPGIPGLTTSAVSAVPADHRYTLTTHRLLLLDTDNKRAREVLRYEPSTRTPETGVEFSAAADGRTLALIVHPAGTRAIVTILDPLTGQVRSLFELDSLSNPVLSPDGARLAYMRISTDAAINGLWIMDFPNGAPQRLVADEPQRVGSPPRPLAWSRDRRWLAIAANTGTPGADVVAAVDVSAGATRFDAATGTFVAGDARRVARGTDADWSDGRLLVTSSTGALGGVAQVSAYEVATKTATTVYSPPKERSVAGGVWRPNANAFAVVEGPAFSGPGEPLVIWFRGLDGSAQRLSQVEFVVDLWWSRDGSRLFALTGGDDSVGGVLEAFSGATFPICLRGGDPPSCL